MPGSAAPEIDSFGVKQKLYETIEQNWVTPLDERVSAARYEENASRWADMSYDEMLADLGVDEHTRYIPPSRWAELSSREAQADQVSTISWQQTPLNIAYIRISRFDSGTAADFRGVLTQVSRTTPKVIILDLRGNTGGFLDACIDVAGLLLEGGPVGRMVTRTDTEIYTADAGALVSETPLYILVDQTTGSGAELVATALQLRERAITVGTPTAGLGNIRTVFPFNENGISSGLFLTTAYFTGPDGEAIEGNGVPLNRLLAPGEDALSVAFDMIADAEEGGVPERTIKLGDTEERALLDAINDSIALPEIVREDDSAPPEEPEE